MKFETLRIANRRRCGKAFHPLMEWSKRDWALAVAGETGEMCNKVKKQRRGDGVTNTAIAREIADIVIYADLLCSRMGIRLEDAVREKFNTVSIRCKSDIYID